MENGDKFDRIAGKLIRGDNLIKIWLTMSAVGSIGNMRIDAQA